MTWRTREGSAATFVALLIGLALAASACSGGSSSNRNSPAPLVNGPICDVSAAPPPAALQTSPIPTPSLTIDQIVSGATPLSILDSETPNSPGPIDYGFDITTQQGQLVTRGAPLVWIAKDKGSAALGPFQAQWFDFTAYAKCHDRSPKSPLPGVYGVHLDVPSTGQWYVAVAVDAGGGQRAVALGDPAANPPTGLQVSEGPVPAQLGIKAISVKTPVATTVAGARQIDTRTPPDPLHSISLDQALTNGKPTVVVFATPLLCETRLCGPAVDEVMLAAQVVGLSKANWIHVEEFLPGPKLKPPAPEPANQSPGFRAWGFQTEPWVVVIDSSGIIRARFEGSVTSGQIEAAVLPLLQG
jgi:hypothetical protein